MWKCRFPQEKMETCPHGMFQQKNKLRDVENSRIYRRENKYLPL
jgi:hypothetical protein